MKKRIYLDNASATKTREEVVKAMLPFFGVNFGNPSAIYEEGREATRVLVLARENVAQVLKCDSNEIVLTSGGTESCNLAILGVVRRAIRDVEVEPRHARVHAITTKVEHHAVLHAFQELEKEGVEVTYLDVDPEGIVDPKAVEKAIQTNTVLVSVMYANNEIGTVQPLREISKIIKRERARRQTIDGSKTPSPQPSPSRGEGEGGGENYSLLTTHYPLFFHSDGCQAAGYLSLIVDKIGVDLLSLNGSKIYGPKGTGILYIRKGTELDPLIFGGSQEFSLRPGTENVAGIVGISLALLLAQAESEKESQRLAKLRDWLINKIEKTIPNVRLNGSRSLRLSNNINFSFKGIEGESIVLYLDRLGIASSTGSACTARNFEPSHVLLALGVDRKMAHGSLRLTLGRETTRTECEYVAKVLPGIVEKLREISTIKVKDS